MFCSLCHKSNLWFCSHSYWIIVNVYVKRITFWLLQGSKIFFDEICQTNWTEIYIFYIPFQNGFYAILQYLLSITKCPSYFQIVHIFDICLFRIKGACPKSSRSIYQSISNVHWIFIYSPFDNHWTKHYLCSESMI